MKNARELSEIYEVNVDDDYSIGQVVGVLGVSGLLVWSLFFYNTAPIEIKENELIAATSTESLPGGVYEENGALFYPDGVPVRNYEQLHIYLQSE